MTHKGSDDYSHSIEFVLLVGLFLVVFVIGYMTTVVGLSLADITRAQTWYEPTQKQGTFDFTQVSPTPQPPPPTPTLPPGVTPSPGPTSAPITPGPLPTGGAVPPTAPVYCIDDEDPDGCDDNTAFHVPKGSGGQTGTCGTVIQQAHRLVNSLPQYLKGMRNSLNPAVSNCGYTTGPYSAPNYISTFFVIDAFNLAGATGLSKSDASHVSGANLLNWWKSNPPGFKFIPYTSTSIQQHASGQQDLTGCVMFLNLGSGAVHPGIFNVFQQVNNNGDGVVSILQAGTRYFLDRFVVAGWAVQNTPQHQTVISGIAGFGCRQ